MGAAASEDLQGAALVRALAAARAAWPGVSVDAERFAHRLATKAAEGNAPPGQLHASDLYLACACADGDAAAIAAFERAFVRPVPEIVERAGYDAATADEVAQTLRDRLLVAEPGAQPRIAEYGGRGSLAGWIRMGALRLASNHRRGEAAHGRRTAPIEAAVDGDIAVLRRQYQGAFDAAFRDALRALDPEESLMLRLHFAEGMNLDAMAAALGASRATIGRRVLSARRRVKDEMLALLRVRLEASETEIESLLDVVRSKLDVSLGALVTSA